MPRLRITSAPAITGFSFAAMFFLGFGVAIVGAAARNVGIPAEKVGILLTAQHLGFFLSVAFAGSLADRYSKPLVLAAGSVAVAIGFGGFYLWPSLLVNVGFMFLLGVGIGVYEGVSDALIMDLHPNRKSLFVNLNHFFTTLGSLMITAYLIFLQMAWRLSMNQATIAVVLLGVLFAISRQERDPGPAAETSEPPVRTLPELLRSPSILLLMLAILCAVGIELGSIAILTTYLMELRGFTQLTSKVGLLLFIAGFGVGRVALGALIRDEAERRWIIGCFGASIVMTMLLYTVQITPLLYVLAFGSGLAMSVLLATIIALTRKMYPEHSGAAIGLVKMGIPVGGMLLPLLLSGATAAFSLQIGLMVFPVGAAVGGVAVLALPVRPDDALG
ncbi:MAG: MFS transporter [Spirochaetaceae bacterium]